MAGRSPHEPDTLPLWWPQIPADAESFAQWSQQPNYQRTSDRRRVFVQSVREALADRRRLAGSHVCALDIGCGWGISEDRVQGAQFLRGVRDTADVLWGIEPDPDVHPDHGLFDWFAHTTLEAADVPAESVDVAYAYYVVEHVPDPQLFLRAVHRLLRPGGHFVFMTPDGDHWFSRVTRMLRRWHADERILRMLRGSTVTAQYHYPVVHRMNDRATIRALAADCGFAPPAFASFDHGDVLPYLPAPLRRPYAAWDRWQTRHGRAPLVCLLGHLTKPLT